MRLKLVPAVTVLPWLYVNKDDYGPCLISKKKKCVSGLPEAKLICKQHVVHKMQEVGAPGMVVAVSVDGVTLWSEGFGLADVENNVPCIPSSVMRVASISKAFTATAMARLWEDGKLDLDKPIQEYLPSFPEKYFNGEKVSITLRQILSHTSGIRHYRKSTEEAEKCKNVSEVEVPEYLLTKQYDSALEALEIFKDDPLLKKPGQEYMYTTHAWTIISAILEEVSGLEFLTLMRDNFRLMGMNHTVADDHQKIIYGRARYYNRESSGRLANVPYVNNSWKWAGGGFLSTVGDLIKFGNIMMYSYQQKTPSEDNAKPSGFLKSDTVHKMWSAAIKCKRKKKSNVPENASYGLGWFVFPEMEHHGLCPESRLEVSHSGGAVGASSVLYLLPNTGPHDGHIYLTSQSQPSTDSMTNCSNLPVAEEKDSETTLGEFTEGCADINMKQVKKKSKKKDIEAIAYPGGEKTASGIAVTIITNMESVGLTELARTIALEFDKTCGSDDFKLKDLHYFLSHQLEIFTEHPSSVVEGVVPNPYVFQAVDGLKDFIEVGENRKLIGNGKYHGATYSWKQRDYYVICSHFGMPQTVACSRMYHLTTDTSLRMFNVIRPVVPNRFVQTQFVDIVIAYKADTTQCFQLAEFHHPHKYCGTCSVEKCRLEGDSFTKHGAGFIKVKQPTPQPTTNILPHRKEFINNFV